MDKTYNLTLNFEQLLIVKALLEHRQKELTYHIKVYILTTDEMTVYQRRLDNVNQLLDQVDIL